MKLRFSLAVIGCLVASSLSADVSTDIKNTFAEGSVSGDIVLYGEQQNNSGANKNAGFTMGSVGLGYQTGDFHGFKAAAGFRANHDFTEVEDGDYGTGNYPTALMHTANISYANDYFSLTLGRQEVDLEWMGDFHEALVGVITSIPDTTIVLGHSQRKATADFDAVLESFEDLGEHGANVLDVKYEGVKGLVLNGYYYNVKDIADFYGAKVDYDTDMFGVTAHYANSSEKVTGTDDGSIIHTELRGNFSGVGLNLGYITTDKDGAIGSMETAGDNINPLEDGNQVYATDADTIYLGVGYELDKLALNAMYGRTKYSSDKENEINVAAEYGVTDEFVLGAIFVNVDAQNGDDDYNKFTFTANYTF